VIDPLERWRESGLPTGHRQAPDYAGMPHTQVPAARRLERVGHIRFAECWDGRRLDSADHKSHMAYATRVGCPSTHPVEVPQITQIYLYPTQGGEGFSLASGGQFSAHADFVNAWKPGAPRKLADDCLNALVHCGRR
jgi:hypothetical protein